METKFHRKITSQTLHFGSQNHQKTAKNQWKKHSKKQRFFKSIFSRFGEGLATVGIRCWACFCLPKSIFFALFSKFQFFIDSGAFWEGLGRVWGGFGESFGRVWGGFGEGLGRFWGWNSQATGETRDGRRIALCAPPPHRGRACWIVNGVLLSLLASKCLPRMFFLKFCPRKLLNPSLFLSPAPRAFRRAAPRWVSFSLVWRFFSKFLLSKRLLNFNFKTTSKKVWK